MQYSLVINLLYREINAHNESLASSLEDFEDESSDASEVDNYIAKRVNRPHEDKNVYLS